MGKHSRRKNGYLPKVAAGAAPVALLFAAPATALASDVTTPLDAITLPVDHHHSGRLTQDDSGITATRKDAVAEQLGDVRLASEVTKAAAVGRDHLGLGESTHQGVWLGHGVDVLSDHAEQLDTGGRFTGVLSGGLAARRTSGQAIDLGDLGAFGVTSEQHATGQFAGVLDVGQSHELGGGAGPASGTLKTSQGWNAAGPTGSISGDLTVDHVIHAEGGTTTSIRGTLTQHQSLTASVLDQPVLSLPH